MVLTPNEILMKEFDTKFRGYNAEQVNDFLDIVVANFEQLLSENADLKLQLDSAGEKITYFSQLQESLNSSIVVAQEAAERLKQNARKEAELVLYEAQREADRMLEEATERAQNIVNVTEAMRSNGSEYRRSLEQIVRSQLEKVTSEEYLSFFDDYDQENSELLSQVFQENQASVTDRLRTIENQIEEEVRTVQFPEAPADVDIHMSQNFEAPVEELEPAAEPTPPVSEPVNSPYVEDDRETVLGQTIRIDLPNE